MRDFNYSLLKDLKWDSEIVGYLTAIHEAKGKQELYLKQQPEKLNKLVATGLFAALSYVVFTFLQINIYSCCSSFATQFITNFTN